MSGQTENNYYIDLAWPALALFLSIFVIVLFTDIGKNPAQPIPVFTDIKSQRVAACSLVDNNKQTHCLNIIVDNPE